MKYLTFIISILFCLQISSQNTKTLSGIVTYRFTPNNYLDSVPNKHVKVFREMYKNTEHIRFILKFTGSTSLFETQEEMSSDFNTMAFSVANRMVAKGRYFTNLTDSIIIRQVETGGETILVSGDLNKETPWQISNVTKKINNLRCYKATKPKSITNDSGTFNFQIIAWFTPEIPAKFGPKEFNNLPGLILELKDTHHTFYAESIKILTKTTPKIIPFRGEVITEEDYIKKTNLGLTNFRKSLKQEK